MEQRDGNGEGGDGDADNAAQAVERALLLLDVALDLRLRVLGEARGV
ncbi:MAG: hypothetical protein J2P50_15815 [Hyphomicrobiaceae bacterium]|nr:hypothetical protein [Hyphomicrobiaceae bacterium]